MSKDLEKILEKLDKVQETSVRSDERMIAVQSDISELKVDVKELHAQQTSSTLELGKVRGSIDLMKAEGVGEKSGWGKKGIWAGVITAVATVFGGLLAYFK